MRRLLTLAVLSVFFSSSAHAVTLKTGMPSCVSEDLFMQMAHAAADNDMEALTWLAGNGCGVSQRPIHVSILDIDGPLAHVRAYRGTIAVEVWTPVEALDGYNP